MKTFSFSSIIISLLLAMMFSSPVWSKKDLPAVNDEGMELINDTRMTTIYADPGADLGIYKRIWLEDASVAFKKNWMRDQNRQTRSASLRVKDSDVERIRQDVATLFREVFTAELVEGGYELVEEAGEDVLIAKPAIVDLDVVAPDLKTAQRTSTFSESAGEMTLVLELYESLTHDKIVTARDRKRDYERGYVEWRTSVSNRATAKRMMSSWARAFRESLDDARASVTTSD
jgi:hypothetical protein